jgi:hypothetical protein
MRTERELTREARRILRKLLNGAHLERNTDGRYSVMLRASGARHAKTKIDASLAQAMCAKDWLQAELGDPARLFLSAAGRAWLARSEAGDDPFAAQHQWRRRRTLLDEQGREHVVTFNAAESPLILMSLRGLIDQVQCEAGERLRRDYTPVVLGRNGAQSGAVLPDTVLAAKQRFSNAMRAAGPGLSDILFDVCCHLHGLEHSERARGWPRSSAKVVLKIALDRLAAHYGMQFAPRPARLRNWAMDDGQAPPPLYSEG